MEKEREKMMPAARRSVTAVAAKEGEGGKRGSDSGRGVR